MLSITGERKTPESNEKGQMVYCSGSEPVVRVPLVVRKAVSGGTLQTLSFHVKMSSNYY